MSTTQKEITLNILEDRVERCLMSKKDITCVLGFFEYIDFEKLGMLTNKKCYEYIKTLDLPLIDTMRIYSNIKNTIIKDFGIKSDGWLDEAWIDKLATISSLEKDLSNYITKEEWDAFEKRAEETLCKSDYWYGIVKYRAIALAWYGVPYRDISKLAKEDITISEDRKTAYIKNKTKRIAKYGDVKIESQPLVDFLYQYKTGTLPKEYALESGEKIFARKNGGLRNLHIDLNNFFDEETIKIVDAKMTDIFFSGSLYRYHIGSREKKEREEELIAGAGNKQLLTYFKKIKKIMYKN